MADLIISGAEEMYRAFLRGIRGQHTGVVLPEYWNPFINEVQLQVIKKKLPLNEFDQTHIDELNQLRVVTDSSGMTFGYDAIPESNIDGVFQMPVGTWTITNGIPFVSISTENYPLYLHGINVMFKTTAVSWIGARLLRSDVRNMVFDNPYRNPSTTMVYFENIGGQIRVYGGNVSGQQGAAMRLEYYRYPKLIQYSATPASVIDPELGESMNQEIVDEAIRVFLERKTDPRYKTYINEMMIGKQTN